MQVPYLNVTWLCSSGNINVKGIFKLTVKNSKKSESSTVISHWKLSVNIDHHINSQKSKRSGSTTVMRHFKLLVSVDHDINSPEK